MVLNMSAFWQPTLKRTFPDKRLTRTDVSKNLEIIYEARNRIAHHEIIVGTKFSETIDVIKFIVKNLNPKKP